MREHLRTLRTSNESLVQRLDTDDVPELEDSRKQLEALIDLVDADSFEATVHQVESLQQQVDALYEEKERLVAAGFASADEALQEIDRLTDTCEELRSRLDASAQPITGDADHEASPSDLYVDRPAAAPASERPAPSNSAEASTPSDVEVQALCDAVAHANRVFYDHLDENENDEVRASLSEIPLDEQATQLRDYADQLGGLWQNVVEPAHTVVREAQSTLGMTSIADFDTMSEQTEELTNLTATLYDATAPHLSDLPSNADALPSGPATAQLRASVSRLRSLTEAAQAPNAFAGAGSGLDPEIGRILGVSTVQEAQEMMHIVKRMAAEIDQSKVEIQNQHSTLTALFQQHVLVDAEALERLSTLLGYDTVPTTTAANRRAREAELHPLNEHLRTLIDDGSRVLEHSDASSEEGALSATPSTIPDVLDALRQHVEALQHRLNAADSNTSEKLARAGIGSAEDAIDMIESMSVQLSELYSAQEAMLDQAQGGNDGQSTFQQLEALYAEQDKLQRELGISDADSLISMVETMSAQLSDLYEERDDDAIEAPSDSSESAPRQEEPSPSSQTSMLDDQQEASIREDDTPEDDDTLAIVHMLQEKAETLAAAVERLQTRTEEQEKAIEQLERTQSMPASTDSDSEQTSKSVASESADDGDARAHSKDSSDAVPDADSNAEPKSASDSPATESGETSRFELSASEPVFDTEQLNALHTAEPSRWDDHSVGVVQLDDDGTVQYVNEAACQLPRLQNATPDEVVGQNFFTDLALSTNNDLFRGRFERGTECDAMQVCFPYTFIAPGYAPTVFNVHMHRHPRASSNWILLETP
jgi:photoactive yellow protein